MQTRNEDLPDPVVVEPAHDVLVAVPGIEVADDAGRLRVRSPDRETRAHHVLVRPVVRAEHLPDLLVTPLAPEVQVGRADAWHETVGVAGNPLGRVVVTGLQLVGLARPRRDALPQSPVDVLQGDPGAVGSDGRDRLRERAHRSDEEVVADGVLAEGIVWMRVAPLDERGDVVGMQGRGDRARRDVFGGWLLGVSHHGIFR